MDIFKHEIRCPRCDGWCRYNGEENSWKCSCGFWIYENEINVEREVITLCGGEEIELETRKEVKSMPHYGDGTKVELLDVVTFPHPYYGADNPPVIAGAVVGLYPGSETCNLQVAVYREHDPSITFNGQCLVATDAEGQRHALMSETLTVTASDAALIHRTSKDAQGS